MRGVLVEEKFCMMGLSSWNANIFSYSSCSKEIYSFQVSSISKKKKKTTMKNTAITLLKSFWYKPVVMKVFFISVFL